MKSDRIKGRRPGIHEIKSQNTDYMFRQIQVPQATEKFDSLQS